MVDLSPTSCHLFPTDASTRLIWVEGDVVFVNGSREIVYAANVFVSYGSYICLCAWFS
jgi:hypothetical protein